MKRIEFIAPVAAMRGNLSGKQDLKYALNDNPASDAPDGENAARNYDARYIGAKFAKSGLCFFTVKTRHIAVKNISTMSIMGITASIAQMKSDLLRNHTAENLQLTALYVQAKAAGYEGTRNKYFFDHCYEALKSKSRTISFVVGESELYFKNPYYIDSVAGTEVELQVKPATFVKFAPYLATNGSYVGGVNATFEGEGQSARIFAPVTGAQGALPTWEALSLLKTPNPSLGESLNPLIIDETNVLWNGLGVKDGSTVVTKSVAVKATQYTLYSRS